MKSRHVLALSLPLLLASGCVPKIDKAVPIASVSVNADLEKAGGDFDDAALVSDWWRGYGDEQLNAIVEAALSSAPTLKAIEARYAQANSIIDSVQSRNLPRLSADASLVRERFSENHIFPPPLGGSTNTQYRPALSLDYDFDFWNARSAHILAAQNGALAQRASLEAAKVALSSAICDTYLSWYYEERKRALLSGLEQTARDELAIVEKQYRLGLIDAVAVHEKKGALLHLSQRVAEQKRSIEGKKEAIGVLGGFLPSYMDRLKTPDIREPFKLPLPKEILLDLLSHRADIAMAKYTALSKSHTIEQTKARFYPNISLSGVIGFTSFNWAKLLERTSYTPSAGIALSLPLLDWGERNADLQNSVSDYNASVYEYNQAVIKAANEVVVLLKQSRLVQSQQTLHREEMETKKGRASIAYRQFAQGFGNKLPYLAAQQTLGEGELESLSLNETAALIQIRLITSLGGGYRERGEENARR